MGYMHASPPCQELSNLNRWRNMDELKTNLFPLLDQARLTLQLPLGCRQALALQSLQPCMHPALGLCMRSGM